MAAAINQSRTLSWLAKLACCHYRSLLNALKTREHPDQEATRRRLKKECSNTKTYSTSVHDCDDAQTGKACDSKTGGKAALARRRRAITFDDVSHLTSLAGLWWPEGEAKSAANNEQ